MKHLITIGSLFISGIVWAQVQDSTPCNRTALSGYVKQMAILTASKNADTLSALDLTHVRLNLSGTVFQKIHFALSARSRVLWGKDPESSNPASSSRETLLPLTITWASRPHLFATSTADRLWVSWKKSKWELTAGRQRINWGISTVWNPNDLYNNYNLLDFDYEERPGADAFRIDYQLTPFQGFSAVAAPGGKKTYAILYRCNYKGFDLQFNGGNYQDQWTTGAGWAGALGGAGFRGELQYYIPHALTKAAFLGTVECDYAFEKGWYAKSALLYCSEGYQGLSGTENLNFLSLSPKLLMPVRWTTLLQAAKLFTPLVNGNFTLLYAPHTHLLVLFPMVTFNIRENIDLDWVGQSFFNSVNGHFSARSHQLYFRVKWSF